MNPLLLKFLPYKWLGVGLVLLGLLVMIGADKITIAGLRSKLATAKLVMADHLRKDAAAAERAEIKERKEEARRAAAQQKADDDHTAQLTRARSDALIADAAAGRLQQRYAALVAARRQAGSDPAAAPSGTAEPAGLSIARQYVDAAEDAITRGELAERRYQALIEPKP
jgi:Protein of unknown function (DUF2514)